MINNSVENKTLFIIKSLINFKSTKYVAKLLIFMSHSGYGTHMHYINL